MLKANSRNMPISEIKIYSSFAESEPARSKVNARKAFYNVTGRFDKAVLIDGNNYLFDGYSSYIAAQEMGMDRLSVLQVVNINRAKKERPAPDKPKYKSGDKVRVVANTCCHEFQMGEILTLAGQTIKCGNPAWLIEGNNIYVREADIEPCIEDKPEFKVGDMVKLRDWKSLWSWANDIKGSPLTIREICDDGSCIVFENPYLYQLEWFEPYAESEQKPLIVTLGMLRKLGACSNGQAAFVTYFPDEKGEFDAVIRKCHEVARANDAHWLECHIYQITEMQDEAKKSLNQNTTTARLCAHQTNMVH